MYMRKMDNDSIFEIAVLTFQMQRLNGVISQGLNATNVNSNKIRCSDGMERKKNCCFNIEVPGRTTPAEICLTIKNKIKHWHNCSTVANNNKEKIGDYPFTFKD